MGPADLIWQKQNKEFKHVSLLLFGELLERKQFKSRTMQLTVYPVRHTYKNWNHGMRESPHKSEASSRGLRARFACLVLGSSLSRKLSSIWGFYFFFYPYFPPLTKKVCMLPKPTLLTLFRNFQVNILCFFAFYVAAWLHMRCSQVSGTKVYFLISAKEPCAFVEVVCVCLMLIHIYYPRSNPLTKVPYFARSVEDAVRKALLRLKDFTAWKLGGANAQSLGSR